MRRTATLLVAIALGGMLLGACSSDEEAEPVAIEVTQTGEAPGLKAPTSVDKGFVEIAFKNSAQLPVDVQLVATEGNQSPEQVVRDTFGNEEGPIPAYIVGAGGVGTIPPGQTTNVTMNLKEGRYVVIGNLETEGEGEGPPPATSVMEVAEDGNGTLPETDATVTAKDYTFEAEGLKPGRNTITFENTGDQLHHFIAAPMNQGATLDQVKTFFTTEGEPTGPPPVDFEAGVGTAVIAPDEELTTTMEFKPGKYAFVCFIQDRAGSAPHVVSHNMIKEITVAS